MIPPSPDLNLLESWGQWFSIEVYQGQKSQARVESGSARGPGAVLVRPLGSPWPTQASWIWGITALKHVRTNLSQGALVSWKGLELAGLKKKKAGIRRPDDRSLRRIDVVSNQRRPEMIIFPHREMLPLRRSTYPHP